jgi:flagellar secretion chaperone FliS
MTMRDPVRAYRESSVRGASPVGLVVILYDEIMRSLRKANRAIQERNIEERTREVNHAIEVIGYLQVTLNFDAGGEVAKNLSHFYNLSRTKILEANVRGDSQILEQLVSDFSQVASAWQQLDRRVSANLAREGKSFEGAAVANTVSALPDPAGVEP